jgi:ubiquitin C-terminal hydrolase
MEEISAEGKEMVESLFQGEFESYLECTDVDYKRSTPEKFVEVQLPIQRPDMSVVSTLEEALRDYVKPEILEGRK